MKKSLWLRNGLRWLVDCVLFLEGLATGEVCDPFVLVLISVELFRINSVFIVDTAIELSNPDKLSSLFHKELRSPVADITKALHNESLALDPNLHSKILSNLLIVEHLLSTVENSESG